MRRTDGMGMVREGREWEGESKRSVGWEVMGWGCQRLLVGISLRRSPRGEVSKRHCLENTGDAGVGFLSNPV